MNHDYYLNAANENWIWIWDHGNNEHASGQVRLGSQKPKTMLSPV